MGANINWGATDDEILFTDADTRTWRPHAVKLNRLSRQTKLFGGGVYQVSPDGKWALSCSLEKMRRSQFGYGVMIPDELVRVHWELRADDGLLPDLA